VASSIFDVPSSTSTIPRPAAATPPAVRTQPATDRPEPLRGWSAGGPPPGVKRGALVGPPAAPRGGGGVGEAGGGAGGGAGRGGRGGRWRGGWRGSFRPTTSLDLLQPHHQRAGLVLVDGHLLDVTFVTVGPDLDVDLARDHRSGLAQREGTHRPPVDQHGGT